MKDKQQRKGDVPSETSAIMSVAPSKDGITAPWIEDTNVACDMPASLVQIQPPAESTEGH